MKLHMIENRTRIEKQILLGRQAVRKPVQARSKPVSRSASHEPRAMLPKVANDLSKTTAAAITLSPPPSDSGDHVSDAEAAFARSSRLFKRGRSSKNTSPHRLEDRNGYGLRGGGSRLTSSLHDEDLKSGTAATPSTPKIPEQEPLQSPGFFSRLRTNSISNFSFGSFSYDRNPEDKLLDVSKTPEHTWSSESSSDDDFPFGDKPDSRTSSPTFDF